ncbi:MAG: hypothetical protein ACFB0D_02045 [Phormidesmis sp.]
MGTYANEDNSKTVDEKYIIQLTLLGAKIDGVSLQLSSINKSNGALEQRLDVLDKSYNKAMGFIAALTVGIGALGVVSRLYANDLIDRRISETDFVTLVCNAYKDGEHIEPGQLPKLCY